MTGLMSPSMWSSTTSFEPAGAGTAAGAPPRARTDAAARPRQTIPTAAERSARGMPASIRHGGGP